jgi:hypothetical protein
MDKSHLDQIPHCLPQTDVLMTGVRRGLVELNQIPGNKYHGTENKGVQSNSADISAASFCDLWLVGEARF